MRLRSRDRRNGNMYTYPLIYIRLQLSVAAKKSTKMATKWSPAGRAVRSEPFPLLRSVVRNGPEPSRARRCWARRSEPLTARTVLRGSLKRERRGARLAKSGPPFWCPRPPPLTETGYHDAGERYRCVECGQTGDTADVEDCRGCAELGEAPVLPCVACGT